MLVIISAFQSCSKEVNETENSVDFSAITSTSQLSGTWGRSISTGYEYWIFNSDGKNGAYMKTGSTENRFEFTYIIDTIDKYLIDYTKTSDNSTSKIGIGLYNNGDLMVGSERFKKVK